MALWNWLFRRDPPVGILSAPAEAPRRDMTFGGRDYAWMFPPEDVRDVAAWDRYWDAQIAHEVSPVMGDMFSDDRPLIPYMKSRGFRSILCAGNGVSQEPRALAAAGYEVTALDHSQVATKLAQALQPTAEYLDIFVDASSRNSEEDATYVAGDLFDPDCAPGPFDVIIERRTLQLHRGADFDRALQALITRLRPDGLLFSQAHDGGWRPPAPRVHPAERSLAAQGWLIWKGNLEAAPHERLARLMVTTG
jgi:SAM-dependent methyltransferase